MYRIIITVFKTKNIILVLLLILNIENQSLVAQNNENPIEILFIGNSYFNYCDLPGMFNKFTEESVEEAYIDEYVPSGTSLGEHANSGVTEAKIKEKDWDYIIITASGAYMVYPDYFSDQHFYSELMQLKRTIIENCATAQIIFCLPWADEDGMLWAGMTDNYAKMQLKIYHRTLQISNDQNFIIAPVGWVWYKVLEEKNYPLHYLHTSDMYHPSCRGTYLMACTIYSTIFAQSTEGIPYYSRFDTTEAKYFQTIASNIVLNDLDLWNIDTNYTYHNKKTISHLSQNYPNPFNSLTNIEYEVFKESKIKIEVLDILGKTIAILVNEQKLPGIYSVDFDGNKIKNGIYFYSLKTDNDIQIKKMQLIK
jgi:hypothetical protein